MVVQIMYQPACSLTITSNPDNTCRYAVTWSMASAWEYIGDDNVTTPLSQHGIGYNDCVTLNRATWYYSSQVGEECNSPKTLTLGTGQYDVITQGWCDMMHVVGQTNNPDNPIGNPEDTEGPEGTFIDDGAFCSAGPSFVQTITIEPMP